MAIRRNCQSRRDYDFVAFEYDSERLWQKAKCLSTYAVIAAKPLG
jgi:hypothetical protein